MRYDIILLWLNTDKRMRTFSIMSDFDKVFEQVWNVNLFSNDSADVMKVHWKLWDFGSDLLCHDLRSHDHWPDFGHTLVSITKTLFPTPNLSQAHYWHRVRETQACHLVQRTVIKEVPKGKSSDDRYRNIASTKTPDPRAFVLDWKGERARISRNPALVWTRGAHLSISTKKSNEKS